MQNNWDLQFAMTIETDEEQGIVSMLEEVIRRLKNGEVEGKGNYCYGVYEFSIVEWLKSLPDEPPEAWMCFDCRIRPATFEGRCSDCNEMETAVEEAEQLHHERWLNGEE